MGGISEGDIDEASFRKSADIMHKLRDLGLRSSAETPATWFCMNRTKEGQFLIEAWTDEAGTQNIPSALVAMSIINNRSDVTTAPRFSANDPQGHQKWQISILPDKFNEAALDRWVAPGAVHVANDDVKAKPAPQIGAIESTGEHKGEIFGGTYPADNKPIWFSAAPKLMDHYAAAAWAKDQGGSLPTRKQGDYLTTLKAKGGAFTEIFNRGGSFPAGYVWLAEPNADSRNDAWCQEVRSGDQGNYHRDTELPVLSVRR